MNILRRHFKTVTIFLITVIVCLSVLIIVDGINDRVNGREAQGFSSSLRQIRPVDVPGMINHVASRINGDLVHPNDITLNESDDDDDDESKSDTDDWAGDEEEDDDDWPDDEGGGDMNVKNTDQMYKLEQLTLDPSLVKIKEKMIARQAHLHKECARLGMRRLNLDDPEDMSDVIAHNGNLDTIFWNDKFKFITSVIFKSGSSNWKKFLTELAAKQGAVRNFPPQLQKAHYKADQPLSSLAKTSLEVKYRLKNYLKVVTVRHPLIRFVSGYRDKFLEHTDKFRKDIPKMIIDSRKGDTRASGAISRGGPKRVTFPEFADYVTRLQSSDRDFNDAHWARQYIRSRPCQHDYDIIAKLETSDDDMDFIKRVVGIDNKLLFLPEYTERHEVSNNDTLAVSYYKQLSDETFQRVCDYYRVDFALFGYYLPKSVNDIARIFDDFF